MKTRFKELAFLAIMVVFIPMSLSAQKSDGFFKAYENTYDIISVKGEILW